jgi:CheY-like chemotaxis protein
MKLSPPGGEEALDLIRRNGHGIDLVVLDMIMPGMGGGKVFDRIRALRPQLPVLLSSGYAFNAEAEKIINRGCKASSGNPSISRCCPARFENL